MTARISSVTRSNIIDGLHAGGYSWSGRLEEHVFLDRLFDLKHLPSTDHRLQDFPTAYEDIWQHRVNNPQDWPDDWLFHDDRFRELRVEDEAFLRFLSATLHPEVRRDFDEVRRILEIYNEHLRVDGYEILRDGEISGRPTFSWQALDAGPITQSIEAARTELRGFRYIHQLISRMQSALLSNDTELAIGTAKELLESVCKTILNERDVAYPAGIKIPKLIHVTTSNLPLDSLGLSDRASPQKLAAGISSVVQAVGEIRGEVGSGHGKPGTTASPSPHLAFLLVEQSSSLALFLYRVHRGSEADDDVEADLRSQMT